MDFSAINKTKTKEPSNVTVGKVAGVSFVFAYPGNLHRLSEQLQDLPEGLPAVLVRAPENPHDPNAVEIHVDGAMIGHLPRETASEAAPLLDADKTYTCCIFSVRISPEAPELPGASFRLSFTGERPPEKKKQYDPFGGLARSTAQEKPRAAFATIKRLEKVAAEKRNNPSPSPAEPTQYYNADGTEVPF